MARVEKLLIKLIVIHFLFLIASQVLLTREEYRIYLSKAIYYEGVLKELPPLIKRQ
ncbi:YpfB family protein [Bacillus sp. RAR_GA_16]|nr:YpfB family protein [Bacillus sp. RAR_GA_16]